MPETITTEAALRDLIGSPTDVVHTKISDSVNTLTRQFIERSPFMLLATSAADGTCDVSPRGDPAGFVHIVDERTLLVPERPGNRLADSLRNILANPNVGLLFLVPGVGDTLRVNGRATITTDGTLLEPLAVEGKTPELGLLIDVDEVFTHCSKAFIRSDLWNPEQHVERAELPSQGAILRSLNPDIDAGDLRPGARGAVRAARRALLIYGVRRRSVAAPSTRASSMAPITIPTSAQKRGPRVGSCAARSSASKA